MREQIKHLLAMFLAFFRRTTKARGREASAAPAITIHPTIAHEQAERSNTYHGQSNLLGTDDSWRHGETRIGSQQEPGPIPDVSPPLPGTVLPTLSGPNGIARPVSGPLTRPVQGSQGESEEIPTTDADSSSDHLAEISVSPPQSETPEESARRREDEIRFGFARYLYQRGKLNEGLDHENEKRNL